MPVAGPIYNNDDNEKYSAENVSFLFTNKFVIMKWHLSCANNVKFLLNCIIYFLSRNI